MHKYIFRYAVKEDAALVLQFIKDMHHQTLGQRSIKQGVFLSAECFQLRHLSTGQCGRVDLAAGQFPAQNLGDGAAVEGSGYSAVDPFFVGDNGVVGQRRDQDEPVFPQAAVLSFQNDIDVTLGHRNDLKPGVAMVLPEHRLIYLTFAVRKTKFLCF